MSIVTKFIYMSVAVLVVSSAALYSAAGLKTVSKSQDILYQMESGSGSEFVEATEEDTYTKGSEIISYLIGGMEIVSISYEGITYQAWENTKLIEKIVPMGTYKLFRSYSTNASVPDMIYITKIH